MNPEHCFAHAGVWPGAGVDDGTLLCKQASSDLTKARQSIAEAVPSPGGA